VWGETVIGEPEGTSKEKICLRGEIRLLKENKVC